ncbi:MAG: response regulator [Lepagella sp.]
MSEQTEPTEHSSRYLILEDSYYTALDIQETMRRLRPGFQLMDITDDTAEAIRRIRRQGVDMMIADTSASDGDSIGKLTDASISTPVIFISECRDSMERAKRLNMIDYILKPVTLSDLRCALSRYDILKQHNY